MLAACSPVASPLPPASTPTSLTDGSLRKPAKRPIAFEPPPTQAMAWSGSLPYSFRHWRRASRPMTLWKSRTIAGYGAGPATVPIT